jgi:NAD(P)-dependent dehydrogenase (short-subunit alcohol dehydrogenase family)
VSEAPLKSRRIVVGGGTGDVGVDVVAALLDAGAEVIVPLRSVGKGEELRSSLRDASRLALIDGFPEDDAGVGALADAVGEIHGAVAAIGSWRRAHPLTALPLEEWDYVSSGNLTAHFLFAKAVVPRLTRGGQYIIINGAGALQPVPQSGHVSIMACAQLMLGEVLRSENPHLLIHTLMLKSVIATRARQRPDQTWVTSREVGAMTAWIFSEQGRLTAGSTITLSPRSVGEPAA